jgi:hypothetical protein
MEYHGAAALAATIVPVLSKVYELGDFLSLEDWGLLELFFVDEFFFLVPYLINLPRPLNLAKKNSLVMELKELRPPLEIWSSLTS